MKTARTTFLMTPEEKVALDRRAASRGVSSGEYIRLAVDNFGKVSNGDEAELAALAAELKSAIPEIRKSLDRSSKVLRDLHRENEDFFRARGIR